MKARSIHIGLNKVDPKHYGSDAPLAGCHNDARDMRDLARSAGFTAAEPLLDQNATVAKVNSALLAAAAELAAGDSLLVTYSGHGSQIPDANLSDDELDHADETWCLYDRMLLDDELAAIWATFKKGVRITVLSDSCHSGTATRAPEFTPPGALAHPRGRDLPLKLRDHAVADWSEGYRQIQLDSAARSIVISAAVILISGCQDDETSLDGDGNGLFTGALLEVWQGGQFKGSLRQLQKKIRAKIKGSQHPNYFATGAVDSTFAAAPALRPVAAR